MAILRKSKNVNFTIVNNYFIEDKKLKLDGKGFLLYMLHKPDDWHFSFSNFEKDLGIGEKAIRRLIKMLEDLKYLKRVELRDKTGKFNWNYFIYEEPYDTRQKNENSPCIPLRDPVEPCAVDGNIILNTNITNDNNDINDKTKIKHPCLIKELIKSNYINENDEQIFLYDSLFNKYIDDCYEYVDFYSAIHYIAKKVKENNFKDENGNDIENKFGYFKSSFESNLKKLSAKYNDLWDEENIELITKKKCGREER